MSIKLLIADLDKTVRRPTEGEYTNTPENQTIIPEAAEALSRYADAGYTIVGATNQGGVQCGHKSLEDCIAEQRYTMALAPMIQRVYFCPDGLMPWWLRWARVLGFGLSSCYEVSPSSLNQFQEHYCDEDYSLATGGGSGWGFGSASYRKPGGLMLFLAAQNSVAGTLETWPDEILVAGDQETDRQAAQVLGYRFEWASDWWVSTPA
ncbi:MAG: hypothetical protein AAGF24_01305 [Cyanobacteria bacterium P01_H01_bin.121]